ncbi:hypothetical protein T11_16948, partial [Trichinella zimbabwensis]
LTYLIFMIRDSTRKRVLALLLLSLLALCTSCLVVRGVVCHVHGRWFVMAKNLNHCSVSSSVLNVFYPTQKRPQDH